MKISKTLLSIAFVASTFAATGYAGGKSITLINTESRKNQITFVSDAPLEKITGTASGISGNFSIDLANPAAANGKITVAVNSMKTGSGTRDSHMYGSEWLDEATHKTIVFTLKSLKDVKSSSKGTGKTEINATAVGEFTLHGVTKTMEAPVTITYLNESDETKKVAPGDLVLVQVKFAVPLKDYGVKGKAGIVGNKVGESIDISATLFGSSAAK